MELSRINGRQCTAEVTLIMFIIHILYEISEVLLLACVVSCVSPLTRARYVYAIDVVWWGYCCHVGAVHHVVGNASHLVMHIQLYVAMHSSPLPPHHICWARTTRNTKCMSACWWHMCRLKINTVHILVSAYTVNPLFMYLTTRNFDSVHH